MSPRIDAARKPHFACGPEATPEVIIFKKIILDSLGQNMP